MPQVTTVEARNHFSTLLNRVAFGKERVVLTRRDQELAALVPLEDLRLLERVIEQLEDEMDLEDARQALLEAESEGTISLGRLKTELGL